LLPFYFVRLTGNAGVSRQEKWQYGIFMVAVFSLFGFLYYWNLLGFNF